MRALPCELPNAVPALELLEHHDRHGRAGPATTPPPHPSARRRRSPRAAPRPCARRLSSGGERRTRLHRPPTATTCSPISTSGCASPASAPNPNATTTSRRSAEWFADAARRTGFPTVEIWDDGPWLPAVFAEWPSGDPDAPTVLVYAHHDVQPVDPLELWHTDPFDPTLDGDVLRARGASDDKGQLLFHLLGVRAHLAATGRAAPAVNLKLIVEGEEESGLAALRGAARAPPRPARLRHRRRHRHRHGRPRRPQHRHRHARHGRGHRDASTAPTSTCTPACSAARSPTRPPRSPGSSPRCTTSTAGCRSPASTTTSSSSPTTSATCSPGCRSTTTSSSRSRSRAPCTARRASRRSSASARGPRPRSTASAAATRAPATRRSCPATRS